MLNGWEPGRPLLYRLWTAQITEAFPWDGAAEVQHQNTYFEIETESLVICFRRRVCSMGIEEVMTAYRSPWQNAYVERLNGSIRRECTDHIIVWNERHLEKVLRGYFDYYNNVRSHLGLGFPELPGESLLFVGVF